MYNFYTELYDNHCSGRNDDESRSDCIDRINQRIEDLTGLDMHTAKQLQVHLI